MTKYASAEAASTVTNEVTIAVRTIALFISEPLEQPSKNSYLPVINPLVNESFCAKLKFCEVR